MEPLQWCANLHFDSLASIPSLWLVGQGRPSNTFSFFLWKTNMTNCVTNIFIAKSNKWTSHVGTHCGGAFAATVKTECARSMVSPALETQCVEVDGLLQFKSNSLLRQVVGHNLC